MVHAAAPLRVLIAQRERLVRAGFRALLERHEDVSVVAEAATGSDAVAESVRMQPDVVLLDVALPGLGGVDVIRQILAAADGGRTEVLVLLADAGDDRVFAALRAGARGLLLEDAEPDALVDAVRVVARGETVLAPALASRLVAEVLSRPEHLDTTPRRLEELTARERDRKSVV